MFSTALQNSALASSSSCRTMQILLSLIAVLVVLATSVYCSAPSILVADGLAPSALTLLRSAGANVVERHFAQEEIGAALGEYDAVIIRSATMLTSEIIDAGVGGRLRVIGRAGVGVDNVDVAAAQAAGCWVLNTPGAPTTSLIELTLAHMLSAARGLQDADVGLKSHTCVVGPRGGLGLGLGSSYCPSTLRRSERAEVHPPSSAGGSRGRSAWVPRAARGRATSSQASGSACSASVVRPRALQWRRAR